MFQFFLHERSFPLGVYIFVLYIGALVGPLLSGYIYAGLGWKAVIWFSVVLQLLNSALMFFLLEETNFTRAEPSIALQVVPDEHEQVEAGPSAYDADVDSKNKDLSGGVYIEPVEQVAPVSNGRRGRPKFRGFFTISPYAGGVMKRGLIQPFALIPLPIVLWCGIVYGFYQVFFNMFGNLSSGVLASPPYNFGTGPIGLTFLSPLLGAIPSALWGGAYCDPYALKMARKNHGVSEAEHKLRLFIIPTVLAPIGLLMMGLGPYYGTHWIVYVMGECILNLAGPLASLLVIAYAFDTFHSIDPEDNQGPKCAAQDTAPYLSAIVFIAMCVTFAFGYAITPWSFGWNFKWFGITAAAAATVLNLSVLLMLKYGKMLRKNGEAYYRKVINW
nr:uncharacterized protein CI109_007310 [Kwoniella shandongensis]KAA5524362.1 hypothetical protein CI109_007310 [Kwoniella shandongensis]